MRVGVGADHGGFEMKEQLVTLLQGEGHRANRLREQDI